MYVHRPWFTEIFLEILRDWIHICKYQGDVAVREQTGPHQGDMQMWELGGCREVPTDSTCSSSSGKCFEGSEWLFCWVTEYPQSQGPWPWAQQISFAEYDFIPREVQLFFLVAKKTSKFSNHFALRDTSNLLRQPTGRKNHRMHLSCLEA